MVDALTGVLALQGDFADHIGILRACGYRAAEVRTVLDLNACDALIIPGGESTTIIKMMDRYDLREPIKKLVASGLPVFGTCAGAIVLAARTSDGEPPLELLNVEIKRNAYGRQVDSFEADIPAPLFGEKPLRGAFIRAPVIRSCGENVDLLAELDGSPVLVRQSNILAATFHPEIVGEHRVHRYFLESVVDA